MSKNSESGLSLLEVLLSVALLGIIAVAFSDMLKNALTGQKHVELQGEMEYLRRMMNTMIDCESTFAKAGINPSAPAGACASTSATGGQKGPFLNLYRKTANGNSMPLSTIDANGEIKFGDWSLRVSCSESEQTLVVRAAKRSRIGNSFIKDPLSGTILDFNNQRSLIYGAPPSAIPICFNKSVSKINCRSVTSNWSPTMVTATCAPDENLVGGGLECGTSDSTVIFGTAITSTPNPTNTGWQGDCGLGTNNSAAPGGKLINGTALPAVPPVIFAGGGPNDLGRVTARCCKIVDN